ncbi:hypothetical protein ACQJBY_071527 [Aegilops geniculata]
MALSSCAEPAAGVGGDGIDSVDPRPPSKRGSRRTYVWVRRSSWYARGGLRRCDGAELLCRRRCRRGRRRARFWSVGGAPVRKQRTAAGEKQRPTGCSRFGQRQEIHRPGAWPAARSSRAWSLLRVDFREFKVAEGCFCKKCDSSSLKPPATCFSGRREYNI